jgi:hypothetical protein
VAIVFTSHQQAVGDFQISRHGAGDPMGQGASGAGSDPASELQSAMTPGTDLDRGLVQSGLLGERFLDAGHDTRARSRGVPASVFTAEKMPDPTMAAAPERFAQQEASRDSQRKSAYDPGQDRFGKP